jgi:hypothetical protein
LANRSRFSSAAAPPERPLPLWILYPLFFVAVHAAHWPLLRLPYFWDEGGYYIPAALDFFRTGALIPHSTLTNAHPPLPSLLLSGWWSVTGLTIEGTRTFMTMLAAAALLGVFHLARGLSNAVVASVVTGLTGLYPVWFAQSSLAHADLFAAVFTLWGLSVYFAPATGAKAPFVAEEELVGLKSNPPTERPQPSRSRLLWLAALFSLAALAKETAIVTPVCLALWQGFLLARHRQKADVAAGRGQIAALLFPILPLAAWYAYHLHQTGFLFGNPEFLRYNATANLSAARIVTSLWHRGVHLFFHMNLWVPVLVSAALLTAPKLPGRDSAILSRPVLRALAVVIAGNWLAFSILGGALLTRYLLPVYPLEILLFAALWYQRMKLWWVPAAMTAAAFVAALFINPPYSIAPEDNLTYRDMIVLHQQACAFVAKNYPLATVLTAWPASSELSQPDLGYVPRPLKVDPIENFAYDQVQRAAADPGGYDTALVFSTKWIPPGGLLNLGRRTESTDTAFYDFHRDLSPHEIATLLHGDIVWQRAQNGEWAAVIRFPRSVEASLR